MTLIRVISMVGSDRKSYRSGKKRMGGEVVEKLPQVTL